VETFPLRYSKRLQRGVGPNAGSFRESIRKANSIRTEEENNTVKQVNGAHPFGSRLPGLQNHLHQQQKTNQVQIRFTSQDGQLMMLLLQLSQIYLSKNWYSSNIFIATFAQLSMTSL
jgi:hypothetical protein